MSATTPAAAHSPTQPPAVPPAMLAVLAHIANREVYSFELTYHLDDDPRDQGWLLAISPTNAPEAEHAIIVLNEPTTIDGVISLVDDKPVTLDLLHAIIAHLPPSDFDLGVTVGNIADVTLEDQVTKAAGRYDVEVTDLGAWLITAVQHGWYIAYRRLLLGLEQTMAVVPMAEISFAAGHSIDDQDPIIYTLTTHDQHAQDAHTPRARGPVAGQRVRNEFVEIETLVTTTTTTA